MIDLHCHLDLYPDPVAIVKRCRENGQFVLSVTTTPSAYRGTAALAPDDNLIKTALGLHPQLVAERHRELKLFDELLPSVRWVGEIGLDGGPEFRPTWQLQIRVFQHILASCASDGGRLLSIHSRHAATPVLDGLQSQPDVGVAIMHWFSGTPTELSRAIDMNCWFSVGLPMLQSNKGRAIVSALPRERVLTETDGPFTQHEMRPSFPWDIEDTTRALAEVWVEPEECVKTRLQENLDCLMSAVH